MATSIETASTEATVLTNVPRELRSGQDAFAANIHNSLNFSAMLPHLLSNVTILRQQLAHLVDILFTQWSQINLSQQRNMSFELAANLYIWLGHMANPNGQSQSRRHGVGIRGVAYHWSHT